MTIQPTKPSGVAPLRGGQTPRGPGDVAQPVRRDARRLRATLAA